VFSSSSSSSSSILRSNTFEPDHGNLFHVDVEKELASAHRQLIRHKEAVLKVLASCEDGSKTATRLLRVLDELEETRIRLEKSKDEQA
jgi:hypothetical protein